MIGKGYSEVLGKVIEYKIPQFKAGEKVRNKFITGKHYEVLGYSYERPELVQVKHNGKEILFNANELERV